MTALKRRPRPAKQPRAPATAETARRDGLAPHKLSVTGFLRQLKGNSDEQHLERPPP